MTDQSFPFERRSVLKAGTAGLVILGALSIPTISSAKAPDMTQDWDKTFPRSNVVDHKKVSFKGLSNLTYGN
jgi:hypothetical protein